MKSSFLFPDFFIPPGMVFGHRTQLLDAWQKMPEKIILPEIRSTGGQMDVEILDSPTHDLTVRRRTKNPIRLFRRTRTISIENRIIFDARYETDSNVSHYLLDTMPRILLAKELLSSHGIDEARLLVVLRERAHPVAKRFFGSLGIETFETEARIFGQIIKHGTVAGITTIDDHISHPDTPLHSLVRHTYERALKYRPNSTLQMGEKIFISRRKTRRIENQEEIEKILTKAGFKTVYFEDSDLSFCDQWSIISEAKQIVAIHGAGISPLVFNYLRNRDRDDQRTTKLAEIYGPGFFNGCFRALASALDTKWFGVRGQITPKVVESMDFQGGGHRQAIASFIVDTYSIERVLDEFSKAD